MNDDLLSLNLLSLMSYSAVLRLRYLGKITEKQSDAINGYLARQYHFSLDGSTGLLDYMEKGFEPDEPSKSDKTPFAVVYTPKLVELSQSPGSPSERAQVVKI